MHNHTNGVVEWNRGVCDELTRRYRRERLRIVVQKTRPRALRSLGLQTYPSIGCLGVGCIGLPATGLKSILLDNKLNARGSSGLVIGKNIGVLEWWSTGILGC